MSAAVAVMAVAALSACSGTGLPDGNAAFAVWSETFDGSSPTKLCEAVPDGLLDAAEVGNVQPKATGPTASPDKDFPGRGVTCDWRGLDPFVATVIASEFESTQVVADYLETTEAQIEDSLSTSKPEDGEKVTVDSGEGELRVSVLSMLEGGDDSDGGALREENVCFRTLGNRTMSVSAAGKEGEVPSIDEACDAAASTFDELSK